MTHIRPESLNKRLREMLLLSAKIREAAKKTELKIVDKKP